MVLDSFLKMRTLFWIGILLTTVFLSCESEEDKKAQEEQRLEEEAERRVATYITVLEKNCQTKVLDEAVRIADSLLIIEARLSTDTLFKPLKPLRPDKPDTKILQDTTPIQPFLKPRRDTIDTIQR